MQTLFEYMFKFFKISFDFGDITISFFDIFIMSFALRFFIWLITFDWSKADDIIKISKNEMLISPKSKVILKNLNIYSNNVCIFTP